MLDAPTARRTRPSVARVRIALDLRQKRVDRVRRVLFLAFGSVFCMNRCRLFVRSVRQWVMGPMCKRRGGTGVPELEPEPMVEEVVAEVVEAAVQGVLEELAEVVMAEGEQGAAEEDVGVGPGCGLGPRVGEAGPEVEHEGGLEQEALAVGQDGVGPEHLGPDVEHDVGLGMEHVVGLKGFGPDEEQSKGKKKRRKKANVIKDGLGVQTRSMSALAQGGNSTSCFFNSKMDDGVGLGVNSDFNSGTFEMGVNSKFFGDELGLDPLLNEFNNSGLKGGGPRSAKMGLELSGPGSELVNIINSGLDVADNDLDVVGSKVGGVVVESGLGLGAVVADFVSGMCVTGGPVGVDLIGRGNDDVVVMKQGAVDFSGLGGSERRDFGLSCGPKNVAEQAGIKICSGVADAASAGQNVRPALENFNFSAGDDIGQGKAAGVGLTAGPVSRLEFGPVAAQISSGSGLVSGLNYGDLNLEISPEMERKTVGKNDDVGEEFKGGVVEKNVVDVVLNTFYEFSMDGPVA